MTLKKTILKYLPLHYFKSYRSYSQDGEDMVLKAIFENKKGYKGFYVDVGAHHPVRYSNTYYFYKKGWQGINIEPTPTSARIFKLLRSRDINLNIGIGPKEEKLTFYCFNEPALNTFSGDVAFSVANAGKYKIIKEMEVPVFPLKDILEQYVPKGKKIDFLSIDVEGYDFQVLQSNDWNRFKPEIILIEEGINMEELGQSEIFNYLKEAGYEFFAKTLRTNFYRLKKP